jgi:Tetracyclin repressor-like, C-terminal domain
MRAMTRRNLADPDGMALIQAHWEAMAIPRIANALGIAEANAAVVVSFILGLTVADSFIGITQLSRMSEDELAAPVLDRYFRPRP